MQKSHDPVGGHVLGLYLMCMCMYIHIPACYMPCLTRESRMNEDCCNRNLTWRMWKWRWKGKWNWKWRLRSSWGQNKLLLKWEMRLLFVLLMKSLVALQLHVLLFDFERSFGNYLLKQQGMYIYLLVLRMELKSRENASSSEAILPET